jgi:arylsulfatase A-like enzyme
MILRFLAILGVGSILAAGCGGRRSEWNVVFVLVDTLRADHVGCHGYERDTTPFLDRLAGEGVRFANHRSQASWTLSSVSSILTSTYPFRHGLLHPSGRRPLPADAWTLAEILQARAGYATAAFVANGIVVRETGLDQGFDTFEVIPLRHEGSDRAELVNAAALPWLREHADGGPFFLYLHYMDPHDPYDDPAGYRRRYDPDFEGELRGRIQPVFDRMKDNEDWSVDERELRNLVARYDGEIRYVDEKIGEMLEEIDRLGLRDRTVVVVTSDHGEQFLEHGSLKHATSVYDEEIRVPLVIRHPGMPRRGVIVPDPVEAVDVMPTLLELLDLAPVDPLDGRSLVPLLRGGALSAKSVYAETSHGWEWEGRRVVDEKVRHLAVVRQGEKLILRGESRELYDLVADPGETRNLAGERVSRAEALAEEVLAWKREGEARRYEAAEYTPEAMESIKARLRALGYLDDEGVADREPGSDGKGRENR